MKIAVVMVRRMKGVEARYCRRGGGVVVGWGRQRRMSRWVGGVGVGGVIVEGCVG